MENINQGWISLHRKILNWEWYDDIIVCRLFIHLLLKANHTDQKWRGHSIKRGQRITSYAHLAGETGLSIQNVRTAISKLKSTGELTIKTTNKNSVITLLNYDEYQTTNTLPNKRLTNNQQTTNKQLTTNNNDNNVNNENKYKSLKLFKANKDKVISKAKEKYEGKNCELAYEHFVNYCDYKKTNYKDHYIAYLTWIRKDLDNAYGGKITNQTERDEGERRRQATRELLDGRSSLVKAKKM